MLYLTSLPPFGTTVCSIVDSLLLEADRLSCFGFTAVAQNPRTRYHIVQLFPEVLRLFNNSGGWPSELAVSHSFFSGVADQADEYGKR